MRFVYHGRTRIVEPYCHGQSLTGIWFLRGYQASGGFDSLDPRGWPLFRSDALVNIEVTDEVFEPYRPGFKPDDSAIALVRCTA